MPVIYEPTEGSVPGGSVSLQTYLPGMLHYEEVVRRNNNPATRWALVTLGDDDEPDDRGAILVTLG